MGIHIQPQVVTATCDHCGVAESGENKMDITGPKRITSLFWNTCGVGSGVGAGRANANAEPVCKNGDGPILCPTCKYALLALIEKFTAADRRKYEAESEVANDKES